MGQNMSTVMGAVEIVGAISLNIFWWIVVGLIFVNNLATDGLARLQHLLTPSIDSAASELWVVGEGQRSNRRHPRSAWASNQLQRFCRTVLALVLSMGNSSNAIVNLLHEKPWGCLLLHACLPNLHARRLNPLGHHLNLLGPMWMTNLQERSLLGWMRTPYS